MSGACAQLPLFADGELLPAEAAAFTRHLASCPHCPTALGELLVLDDIVAEVDAAAAPGVRVIRPVATENGSRRSFLGRVSRRGFVAAGGVALAAAAAAVLWLRPAPLSGDALLVALADRPYRTQMARLSLPPADRWRPYNPARSGNGSATEAPAEVGGLAAIEESGNARALAAAYFLLGLPTQAAAHLPAGDDSADALSDRAAVQIERGQLDQADGLLRRALALQPRHRQARWNRALVLRARGDRAGAARLFQELAADEQDGWAEEARTLARDLSP